MSCGVSRNVGSTTENSKQNNVSFPLRSHGHPTPCDMIVQLWKR